MARNSIQNANASLYFNGTSAKMTVPVVPDPTGWCFAMWIKPGVKGSVTHTYISYNTAAFTHGFFVGAGAGKSILDVYVYNLNTQLSKLSIVATVGDWVHLAATYLPNGTCKIYRNGVLIDSATSTGTMGVATAQTLTFNSRSYTGSYGESTMSNIVWQNTTTSWTDAQVLDLYNGKAPAGTTMVLPLNEGAGSIAYDTSGNGNNGTITSGTWTRDAPSKTRKGVNGNLVYNGDFEIAPVVNVAQTTGFRWYDGTSSGTTTVSPFGINFIDEGGTCSIMIDNTEKYTGSNSLKISTLATASFVEAAVADSNGDVNIPILPSTSYTYSYWMKTNYVSGAASDGIGVRFLQRNGAKTGVVTTITGNIKTSTGWTYYTGSITTNSAARFMVVKPALDGSTGTGTLIMDAWFDNITLTPTTATTRTATTGPYRKTVENLVTNGDFEYAPAFTAATNTTSRFIDGSAAGSASTSGIYGWYASTLTNSGKAQFDSTTSKFGSSSLKISTTATGGETIVTGTNTIKGALAIGHSVLPSTSYTASGWIKTNLVSGSSTTGTRLRFIERTGAITSINSYYANDPILTTTDWTYYSVTFTTSSTCRFIVPAPSVTGNDGTGTLIMDAWFDDIVLTKTTPDARSTA